MKLDPPAEEEEDLATAVVNDTVEIQRDYGIERVYLDLDDDGASTLIGNETSGMFGQKEIDMEVTDDESVNGDDDRDEACRLKRKRTIRVVIRSRAFL